MGRSWSDPAIPDLSEIEWSGGTVGAYPMDFSQDARESLLTDGNGIPMIDYANLGCHYNPWFVGHIALGYYTRWRRQAEECDRKKFLQMAEWFAQNAEVSNNFAVWLYQFDWFDEEAGWFSGLSQAHAVSVLLRAFNLLHDYRYERLTRGAADCMIADISNGGTATSESGNSLCFQEHRRIPAAYILNGHLFSCFAIWEAGRYFQDKRYQQAAVQGFAFLERNLEQFDLGFWSKYSLLCKAFGLSDIASSHYHDVHVAQLRIAYVMTGKQIFQAFADKFAAYQRNRLCVCKALWWKRLSKLL